MNVYDFDGTIYDGSAWLDFMLFCMKKQPLCFISFPKDAVNLLRLKKNAENGIDFEQTYCSYLRHVNDVDSLIEEFWDKYSKKIKDIYLRRQMHDDIVITGSPEFLIRPICDRLGIKYLIGTRIDKNDGTLTGKVCCHMEKVRRYNLEFPFEEIDDCYTDNLIIDSPLIRRAKRKYLVKGNFVKRIRYRRDN